MAGPSFDVLSTEEAIKIVMDTSVYFQLTKCKIIVHIKTMKKLDLRAQTSCYQKIYKKNLFWENIKFSKKQKGFLSLCWKKLMNSIKYVKEKPIVVFSPPYNILAYN